MLLLKPHTFITTMFLLGLVHGKPKHTNQQGFKKDGFRGNEVANPSTGYASDLNGIEEQDDLKVDDAVAIERKIRQAPATSTASTTTSTSTRIPPANPEITTVYKVPCQCPFTPQYDPVCGSDGQNYGNMQILTCAQFCGSNVTLVYRNACGANRG